LDIEIFSSGDLESFRIEGCQSVDNTVGGQDYETGTVHVDERHHGEFVGRILGFNGTEKAAAGSLARCAHRLLHLGTPLVAVVEGGLVAMMAVGDDQLLVPHLGADKLD